MKGHDVDVEKLGELLAGSGLRVTGSHFHSKASEGFVDVEVTSDEGALVWEGAVPYQYRRTGLFLKSEEEIAEYLVEIKDYFGPEAVALWQERQAEFWEDHGGSVTPLFFETLLSMDWVYSADFPRNPNPQRRIQDIKEMGYTLGTKREGRTFKRKLVPVPRGSATGYETFSKAFRDRALKVLGHVNVYELSAANRKGLIPDHKFPEIRWDEATREENPATMGEAEIRAKFQLLDNQRNQQKREVCRRCFQTGERGVLFGIPFFYEGGPKWPADVPETGKAAEAGCVGCGWYDVAAWRRALIDRLR